MLASAETALVFLVAACAHTNVRRPLMHLDLSADADRQVIVEREPGQYLGHPTTVLLEDGRTLFAAYPRGHGRGRITLAKSTDAGRTWGLCHGTPENWATSLETPTLHRVVAPDGARRLLLFSGLYPVRMAHSEDDGEHWTPLEPVGEWGGIVAMASLERTHDGGLLAFFHDDGRFFRSEGGASGIFTTYVTRSRDGGLSWSPPRALFTSDLLHLCEPGSVRSPDGQEITLLLRENRRVGPSYVSRSRDEGETWSTPQPLDWALTGDRHVAKYAPDGRLVVTFRDMAADSATYGDFVAWVGRYEDIGRGGEYHVRLLDNLSGSDCGYSGLEVLPDGTFVATAYGHWLAGEEPFVVSVRLTLTELDARAAHRSD